MYIGQELTLFNGGYPPAVLVAFNKLIMNIDDHAQDTPYTVFNSGLNDPKDVSTFIKFYGTTYESMWTFELNTSSPIGLSFYAKSPWDTNIPLTSRDGSLFGIYVSKDETLKVFARDFKISIELIYAK